MVLRQLAQFVPNKYKQSVSKKKISITYTCITLEDDLQNKFGSVKSISANNDPKLLFSHNHFLMGLIIPDSPALRVDLPSLEPPDANKEYPKGLPENKSTGKVLPLRSGFCCCPPERAENNSYKLDKNCMHINMLNIQIFKTHITIC